MESSTGASSDSLLQSRHRVGLHDGPRRLRLHQHLLAEDLPLASLGGRLDTSLDHAEAWEGELAGGFDLLCCSLGKACDDLASNVLLELELLRDALCQLTLGHDLAGAFFIAFIGAIMQIAEEGEG